MDLVIRISLDDLKAALLSHESGGSLSLAATAPVEAAPKKKKKAAAPAPVAEDFDESEDEEETPPPAPKKKKKAAAPAPVVEEDDEEEEEAEDEEIEEAEEAEDDEEEEEYVTGAELTNLKKALNAHKAANGGKPAKTFAILKKYAPGGSEKVKPEVLSKLMKALKV